jgi:hypothetical protein
VKNHAFRLFVLATLLVGLGLPLAQPGRAMPVCQWTGAVSADWNNAGNWSCGHVPTIHDVVIIPKVVGGHSPVLNGSAVAETVTIESDAWLTLDPAAQLTVDAGVTLERRGQLSPQTATLVLNRGNWTNNGGILDEPGQSTVVFNGYDDQQINGTATSQVFGNVTVNNMSMTTPELQVGGSTTTLDIGGTLTINADATLDAGTANRVNLGGDLINNGGAFQGRSSLLTRINGSGPQTIGGSASSQTFPGPLIVDKSGGSLSLGGGTTQVNVNGGLDILGGGFNLGSGTLTVNGPTTVAKTGVLNLGSGVWNVNACITIATGGTLNPGNGTLNHSGGTWSNYGGAVNPGNWNANFDLRGTFVMGGSADTHQFHNVGIYNNTMAPAGLVVSGSAQTLIFTGDLQVGDSAALYAGKAQEIHVGGDWRLDGSFVPGPATVIFDGGAPVGSRRPAAVQTIGGAQRTTFNGLTIDNPAGVTLAASQTVSGVLNLKAGDLTTAAYTLTLGSAATVTGTHEVVGAVQRTQAFTIGVPYSFGQPNLTITFAQVGGVTGMAVNAQKSAPDRLRPAVPRTVSITPVGAGYNATLRLPYQDAELGGIAEADLRLWRRGETRWETGGAQVANAAENWVEQSGITAFSTWALAPASASQGDRIYMPLIWR